MDKQVYVNKQYLHLGEIQGYFREKACNLFLTQRQQGKVISIKEAKAIFLPLTANIKS